MQVTNERRLTKVEVLAEAADHLTQVQNLCAKLIAENKRLKETISSSGGHVSLEDEDENNDQGFENTPRNVERHGEVIVRDDDDDDEPDDREPREQLKGDKSQAESPRNTAAANGTVRNSNENGNDSDSNDNGETDKHASADMNPESSNGNSANSSGNQKYDNRHMHNQGHHAHLHTQNNFFNAYKGEQQQQQQLPKLKEHSHLEASSEMSSNRHAET